MIDLDVTSFAAVARCSNTWLIAALQQNWVACFMTCSVACFPLSSVKLDTIFPDMDSSCEIWFQSKQWKCISFVSLSVPSLRDRWECQAAVDEAEEMKVAVDGFTITYWAFDVFERPCELNRDGERWRCSAVNFGAGAGWPGWWVKNKWSLFYPQVKDQRRHRDKKSRAGSAVQWERHYKSD